jgi:hypothetical protein
LVGVEAAVTVRRENSLFTESLFHTAPFLKLDCLIRRVRIEPLYPADQSAGPPTRRTIIRANPPFIYIAGIGPDAIYRVAMPTVHDAVFQD